ncbi:MAG: hypothetical protein HUK22_00375 [Thermoguttaceae bacterium]|nr:hypothetical protein [Thermoguttaceae bacterium]
MKKVYESPALELEVLPVADVIRTSFCPCTPERGYGIDSDHLDEFDDDWD